MAGKFIPFLNSPVKPSARMLSAVRRLMSRAERIHGNEDETPKVPFFRVLSESFVRRCFFSLQGEGTRRSMSPGKLDAPFPHL